MIEMDINEILTDYAQEGFDVTTYEDEQLIVEYIKENQEFCPVSLYRGLMVDDDYKIEVGDTIEFDNTFASFDEDFEKAKDFATRKMYGVVFVIEDTEGLPLYMHADTCHDEQEWLLLDHEYKVVEIKEEEGLKIVRIERVIENA